MADIQKLKTKHEELKLKLTNKLLERKLKKVNAKYDATDPNNEHKRRVAKTETKPEREILNYYKRGKATNFGRDLERNFSNAKSMLKQLKYNVVGTDGKIQFNTDDEEWNVAAASYFNGEWAKDCDLKDDMPWSEMLQLAVSSVIREGDVLCVYDNFLHNSGKLIWYESDQLTTVAEKEWQNQTLWTQEKIVPNGKPGRNPKKTVPMIQDNGLVVDSHGIVHAYIVSMKRGRQGLPMDEVTIIPKSSAKLLKAPFRFNQLRGVGDLLTCVGDLEDLYEIRAKELQSAKVASSLAAFVKKETGTEELLDMNDVQLETLLEETGDEATTQKDENYDNLEMLTGGYTEYLQEGDSIEIPNIDRPNINLKEFFDFVLGSGGGSLGLSKVYATLEASKSYTAFRGEMLIAWVTFNVMQKWLERRLCDWVGIRVIDRAIRNGRLDKIDNWKSKMSWSFPTMPQIDPFKEQNADRQALKNGSKTYSDIHGADWKAKLNELATQIQYARELGLPLSIFETTSGAITDNNTGGDEDEE